MPATAAYDAHADWYEQYVTTAAGDHSRRVHETLRELLGPGTGTCLDVCCGTGARAWTVRELGWSPVGVDLSRGQLRHGRSRLPVAAADAAALPVPDGAVPAAVCALAHTDLPDYPAVLREVARVLRPGGRFVHIGVHPCFIGAFADWSRAPQVLLDARYADRSHTFDAWTSAGVRARVGAWHVPLADLLNGVTEAGLRIARFHEAGPPGVPDLFGLLATAARAPNARPFGESDELLAQPRLADPSFTRHDENGGSTRGQPTQDLRPPPQFGLAPHQ